MNVALTSVPVEEYLRTTYHPDREYVDGQLVERNVGEHYHSLMQGLITTALNVRRRERRFRVFPEQRVRMNDEPRYRIPDICVVRLPYRVTPILVQPDLVIEIVSPDDRPSDLLAKVGEYLRAGIPHIWVVDPYKRSVVEADAGGIREVRNLVAETELTGPVDFGALFEELYEPAE
jgi:Uma2 family endonuclease